MKWRREMKEDGRRVGGRGEPLSPPEPSLVTDAYGFRQ
jgi:hypothetical protein